MHLWKDFFFLLSAMVFELADEWSRKFKSIRVEKPDWYTPSDGFSTHNFTGHVVENLNDTITSHIRSISHNPSSSSGGFSSGGGGGGGSR